MDGQATRETFLIIRDNPIGGTTLTLEDVSNECCVNLEVFAELTPSSDFYNDQNAFLFFWGKGFSTADLYLQHYTGGAWVDLENLNTNDFGTPYAFGFFIDKYQNNAIGYLLQWTDVLNEHGEGRYRVRSTGTILIGGGTVTKYSFEFCLKTYNAYRADGSVRVEWWTSGTIGDVETDLLKRDYGTLNWYNQLRIPNALFGYPTSAFEREFVKYQNGSMVWLKDSQVEEYLLQIGRIDEPFHKYFKFEVMQADEVRVTDYNIGNHLQTQNKYITFVGDYAPEWQTGTQLAKVEIKCQQRYQNANHKRK